MTAPVASPVRWLLGLLVAVHLVSAALTAFSSDWDRPGFTTGDNLRYGEIAEAPGWPYRDFEVEYPPFTLVVLEAIHLADGPTTAGRLLVLIQLLADLAVAAALARAWDPRAAVAWLALLLPFCWGGWIFGRIDLLSVALAVWGLALARRQRETAGGVLLGLGALAKAWPVVVAPALWAERRTAGLRACIVTLVVGGAVWLLVGGFEGLRQVLTFRGTVGWQVESTVGSLLLLDVDRPASTENNALRIGEQLAAVRVVLAVAMAVGLIAAWLLARQAGRRDATTGATASDLAALVSVGLLLVLSPLLSPQFLLWLAPFVAIRWRDWVPLVAMAVAMVLTAYVVADYGDLLEDARRHLSRVLVVRNALLITVVVVGLGRLAAVAARTVRAEVVSAGDAACTTRRTRR